MKKLRKIFVLLGLLVVMVMAHAVKFDDRPNLQCKLTPEQLSDPDLIIESGLKNAYSRFNGLCHNMRIEQKNYFSFDIYHPTKIIADLEKKYGYKRESMTEVESGYFRDFKILNKKLTDPVDGLETLEYDVKILYVLLWGYWHYPGNVKGYMPVCEKNTVKINVIKTDGGWYMISKYDIGKNFDAAKKDFREKKGSMYHKNPKHYEQEIQLQEQLIKRCKLTLN